jgi:hypothetical protein
VRRFVLRALEDVRKGEEVLINYRAEMSNRISQVPLPPKRPALAHVFPTRPRASAGAFRWWWNWCSVKRVEVERRFAGHSHSQQFTDNSRGRFDRRSTASCCAAGTTTTCCTSQRRPRSVHHVASQLRVRAPRLQASSCFPWPLSVNVRAHSLSLSQPLYIALCEGARGGAGRAAVGRGGAPRGPPGR